MLLRERISAHWFIENKDEENVAHDPAKEVIRGAESADVDLELVQDAFNEEFEAAKEG